MIGTTNTVPHTGHKGTTEWSYQQLREALDRQGSLPPVEPQSLLWQTGNAWPWHDEVQAGPDKHGHRWTLRDAHRHLYVLGSSRHHIRRHAISWRVGCSALPPDPTPQPEPGAQWCGYNARASSAHRTTGTAPISSG